MHPAFRILNAFDFRKTHPTFRILNAFDFQTDFNLNANVTFVSLVNAFDAPYIAHYSSIK